MFSGLDRHIIHQFSNAAVLVNAELTDLTIQNAAAAMARSAIPGHYNGFKVELIQRMLVYALSQMRGTS